MGIGVALLVCPATAADFSNAGVTSSSRHKTFNLQEQPLWRLYRARTAHKMPKGRFEARSGAACGATPTA